MIFPRGVLVNHVSQIVGKFPLRSLLYVYESTDVTDRITWVFTISGATRGVAFDITKVSDMVWHAGSLMEFPVRFLTLLINFSVFDRFVWFSMAWLRKDVLLTLFLHKAPSLILLFCCYALM